MTESPEQNKMAKVLELKIESEKQLRREAEANMRKAAEFGKQLLCELQDLKLQKENADQEVYDLKNKLERKIHTSSALEKEAAEDLENLKDANAKLINDKEIAGLQNEAKVSKLVEEQKLKDIDHEKIIKALKDNLADISEQLAEAQHRLLEKSEKEDSSSFNRKYKNATVLINGTSSMEGGIKVLQIDPFALLASYNHLC